MAVYLTHFLQKNPFNANLNTSEMNEDTAKEKFNEQAGNKPSVQDLKELASQLGKPEGEK